MKLILAPYKEPLKPVSEGFGYLGTIALTKDRSKIQCHVCGELFESLASHVVSHNMNPFDYREKFQLSKQTSLISESNRTKRVEAEANVPSVVKLKRLTNLEKGRKKNLDRQKRKPWQHKASRKKSLEQKNKEGRCPDQLLDKIKKLTEEIGHPPGQKDFIKHFGNGYYQSIVSEFGSWNNAKRKMGYPTNEPKAIGRAFYSRATLIAMLQDFYERFGRKPVQADCCKNGLPSRTPFYREFGGWKEALAEAFNNYEMRKDVSDE